VVPLNSTVEVNRSATLQVTLFRMDGVPVTWSELQETHERKLHIVVLSESMTVFGHVHPDDIAMTQPSPEDTTFAVNFSFPQAGRYLVIVDFTANQSGALAVGKKHQTITVSGSPGSSPILFEGPQNTRLAVVSGVSVTSDTYNGAFIGNGSSVGRDDSRNQYDVSLGLPHMVFSGVQYDVMVNYSWHMQRRHSGEDHTSDSLARCLLSNHRDCGVAELHPLLGAAAHAYYMRSGLSYPTHVHATIESPGGMVHSAHGATPSPSSGHGGHRRSGEAVSGRFGPTVWSQLVFPQEGQYVVWIQASRKACDTCSTDLIVAPFYVNVQ